MANERDNQTEQLLAQASCGSERALGDLFALHRAYLRRVIDLRMGNDLRTRIDPSDVIQETQLEATRRIRDYLANQTVPFRIWLRSTAIEQLVNLRRHHVLAEKRAVQREVNLPDGSSIALVQNLLDGRPSQVFRKSELAQQVRQAINEMDDRDREIILLRHIEGLTNQEVAAMLQINSVAASQRHGRALRRFREKLISLGVSRDG